MAARKTTPKKATTRKSKTTAKAKTPFVLGNALWKMRSRSGALPKYEGPAELLEQVVDYFNWVDDNPLKEEKAFQYEGKLVRGDVAKKRPYTLQAMCNHLCVTVTTWGVWRETRADLSEVIEWAESVIYSQKFEGAAAGFFNSNIIARDLGLSDKRDTDGKVQIELMQTFLGGKSDD